MTVWKAAKGDEGEHGGQGGRFMVLGVSTVLHTLGCTFAPQGQPILPPSSSSLSLLSGNFTLSTCLRNALLFAGSIYK